MGLDGGNCDGADGDDTYFRERISISMELMTIVLIDDYDCGGNCDE